MENQLTLVYLNETPFRDSMEILRLKMAMHEIDNGKGRAIKHEPIRRKNLSRHEQ